ncbi:MAG: hypothetical protein IID32_08145, partial [Planctomycetes bacterium]|nr:hypothetical protein [Planctomycetota bacterium]
FFVSELSTISGTVTLYFFATTMTGRFGFLEVDFANVLGEGIVTTLSTLHAGGAQNPISIDDLDPANVSAHLSGPVFGGVLTDGINQFKLDLPGTVNMFGGAVPLDMVLAVGDINDPASATFAVTSPAEDLLRHVVFADVIDTLQSVSDFLGTVQAEPLLAAALPFIGTAANDLNDYASAYSSLINSIASNEVETLQLLEQSFREALGLGPADPGFGLSFDGNRLLIGMKFFNNETTPAAIDVDILALANLSTTISATDLAKLPLDEAHIVSGQNKLYFDVVTRAALDLNLSLNFADPTDPQLLVENTTNIELLIKTEKDNIAFDGYLGAVELTIDNGQGRIYSTTHPEGFASYAVTMGISQPPDADLPGNLVVGIVGQAEIELDSGQFEGATLDIQISSLEDVLNEVPGSVVFATPMPNMNFAPPPNRIFELLRDPSLIITGIDNMFGNLQSVLEFGASLLDLPFIGSGLSDGLQDFFDDLSDLRANLVTSINAEIAAIRDSNDHGVVGVFQSLLFDAFGEVLLDWPDDGDAVTDVNDVIVTVGKKADESDLENEFVQFDMHLGQSYVISLPFELGLHLGDLPFDVLLPNFGFSIDASEGIQFEFAWSVFLGFGLSVEDGFYIRSDAKENSRDIYEWDYDPTAATAVEAYTENTSFDPDAEEVEEIALTMDVTIPGLSAEVSLGLVQGLFSDGTVQRARVTAFDSVNGIAQFSQSFGGPKDFDFNIIIDGVSHPQQTTASSLTGLMLNLQADLLDEGILLAPDLSNIFAPVLSFTTIDPDVKTLVIEGGEELGFAPVQYENSRSVGLGFESGDPSIFTGGKHVLGAPLEAPYAGRLGGDVDFELTLNGNTNDDRIVHVVLRQSRTEDVETLADLVEALQDAVDLALGEAGWNPGDVTVTETSGKLSLESSLSMAIEFSLLENTNMKLAATIDLTDPSDGGRLSLSEIASNPLIETFKPKITADAELRVAVNTNADHIDAFISQAVATLIGIDGFKLGLPKVLFDFKVDAGAQWDPNAEKKDEITTF